MKKQRPSTSCEADWNDRKFMKGNTCFQHLVLAAWNGFDME